MSDTDRGSVSPHNPDGHDRAMQEPTHATKIIPAEMEASASEQKPTETSSSEASIPKRTSASSKSSSVYLKSQSSTIEYEQTPFSEFSIQVQELCHSLWHPSAKEYRRTRVLGVPNNRFLGALRSKKLGRFLWPTTSPKAFEIERLKGGSFNRVCGIKIIGSEGEDPIALILRTSRSPWDSRPDREVATLEYIRRHTSLPVPHIKAFNLTDENPLNTPYILQSRIPGVSLQLAIGDGISHKQWCTLAKEIGHIILELQRITNPAPGVIETSSKKDGVQDFVVSPFDIRDPRDEDWKKKQANSMTFETDNERLRYWYEKDTFHFLATQFGRWRSEELRVSPIGITHRIDMHRLTDVATQMNRLGFLDDNTNCVVHMDLAERNIMVELGPEESIRITGILDWDSAIFAPKFVSCRPPWWLWQDEKFQVDPMVDETNANDDPGDPELREIKTVFEDTVGSEFVRFAYQPQFLIARRLFKIALSGSYSNESMREIDEIVDQWDALYKAEIGDQNSEHDNESAESGEERGADKSR